jgi:hypothetical protein
VALVAGTLASGVAALVVANSSVSVVKPVTNCFG